MSKWVQVSTGFDYLVLGRCINTAVRKPPMEMVGARGGHVKKSLQIEPIVPNRQLPCSDIA